MLRISTLKERELFYKKEFYVSKVKSWFIEKPHLFVLDAGTETGIAKFLKDKGYIINLKLDFKDLMKKLIYYLSEDVYYDRDFYSDTDYSFDKLKFDTFLRQELAFDLDADDLECEKCENKDFAYTCENCLEKSRVYAYKFYNKLKEDFNKIKIVYSGRGFHFHVLDKKAYSLTIKERERINKNWKNSLLTPGFLRGILD